MVLAVCEFLFVEPRNGLAGNSPAEGTKIAWCLLTRKGWLERRSDSSAEYPVEGSLHTEALHLLYASK